MTPHGTNIDLISYPFQVDKQQELFHMSMSMYTPNPPESKDLKMLSMFLQSSLEMNFNISQMKKTSQPPGRYLWISIIHDVFTQVKTLDDAWHTTIKNTHPSKFSYKFEPIFQKQGYQRQSWISCASGMLGLSFGRLNTFHLMLHHRNGTVWKYLIRPSRLRSISFHATFESRTVLWTSKWCLLIQHGQSLKECFAEFL